MQSAEGGALADAAAGCNAELQRHSRGRKVGDAAPGMRRKMATLAGQRCAQIRRPRRAKVVETPGEANWRMQRQNATPIAAAFSCRSVGMEARRRSTTWCCRQAEIGARGGDLSRARGGRSGEALGGGDAARKRHWSGRNAGDAAPRTQSAMEAAAGQECSARRRTQRAAMREPSS